MEKHAGDLAVWHFLFSHCDVVCNVKTKIEVRFNFYTNFELRILCLCACLRKRNTPSTVRLTQYILLIKYTDMLVLR